MEFIKVPFGYLLDWLSQLTGGNYGLALILFSLLVKLVLMPMSAKSRKSMLKMSRLTPQIKALEIEYGDNKDKYQMEVAKLYKQEGVGVMGGCLWSFLPLLILFPLYYVIREPITYMMHFTAEEAEKIVEVISQNVTLSSNQFYHQLEAAGYLWEYRDAVTAALPEINPDMIRYVNFSFLGLDMGGVPDWKFWTFRTWNEVGMFAVPVISAASQMLSMLVSQKMNNKVATNPDGEQDKAAVASSNQTNRTMMLLMPAMSLYFCFVMPAAISIYWVAQAVFGTLQDVYLSIRYRKVYEEEDAIRRENAAILAAKEAERERLREERRAKLGGEGVVDPNTSKKKISRQEQDARTARAEAYAAAKNPAPQDDAQGEAEPEENCISGDPERPYCRGRAYMPDRYGKKSGGDQ